MIAGTRIEAFLMGWRWEPGTFLGLDRDYNCLLVKLDIDSHWAVVRRMDPLEVRLA